MKKTGIRKLETMIKSIIEKTWKQYSKSRPTDWRGKPVFYEINTLVWLDELSHRYGQKIKH
jgi:hypothetical protein